MSNLQEGIGDHLHWKTESVGCSLYTFSAMKFSLENIISKNYQSILFLKNMAYIDWCQTYCVIWSTTSEVFRLCSKMTIATPRDPHNKQKHSDEGNRERWVNWNHGSKVKWCSCITDKIKVLYIDCYILAFCNSVLYYIIYV
jgi:hypothetical protein